MCLSVFDDANFRCGPCRQFTPVLGKVYQEMKAAGKCNKFEVVFCSAGQSESDFQSYFRSMAPWMAIDYDVSSVSGCEMIACASFFFHFLGR